jgi:hypothetical protein
MRRTRVGKRSAEAASRRAEGRSKCEDQDSPTSHPAHDAPGQWADASGYILESPPHGGPWSKKTRKGRHLYSSCNRPLHCVLLYPVYQCTSVTAEVCIARSGETGNRRLAAATCGVVPEVQCDLHGMHRHTNSLALIQGVAQSRRPGLHRIYTGLQPCAHTLCVHMCTQFRILTCNE